MELADLRDQVQQEEHEGDVEKSRIGSESDVSDGKVAGHPPMSTIHDIAFIITICSAQIMALAGIGQGLGMSDKNTATDSADCQDSTVICCRRLFWNNE